MFSTLKWIHILLVYGLLAIPVFSQQESLQEVQSQFKKHYGPNQTLFNGTSFQFPSSRAIGHPFPNSREFGVGYLVINQERFYPVFLNYDLHKQSVILEYSPNTYHLIESELASQETNVKTILKSYDTPKEIGMQYLSLTSDFIEEFYFSGMLFRKYQDQATPPAFYHVIYEGKASCLQHWSKNYSLNSAIGQTQFEYTKTAIRSFLYIDGLLIRFNSNKSFVKGFPEEYQSQISKYLKQNRIQVDKSKDFVIVALMKYCNSIMK